MEKFSLKEERFLRSLSTPDKIQNFLGSIPYHLAGTAFSPRMVIRDRTAHCLEGAIFAAAALRVNGRPPLLFDLEAEHDSDHVLALFREKGAWGAIGISNVGSPHFWLGVVGGGFHDVVNPSCIDTTLFGADGTGEKFSVKLRVVRI